MDQGLARTGEHGTCGLLNLQVRKRDNNRYISEGYGLSNEVETRKRTFRIDAPSRSLGREEIRGPAEAG